MRTADTLEDDEVRLRRKDGTVMDCLRTVSTRRNRDGSVVGYQSVVRDVTRAKRAEQELRESELRLRQALEGTLEVIQQMTEQRDPYTSGHQRRVAELAVAIARELRLPEDSCVSLICTAALVHDIGKIAVPAEILSKPGVLSDTEYTMIRAHPRIGYDILRRASLPEPVPLVVLQHHERLDGSGYPQRLSGDDILPEAQILAVADVVEAMSSHRPYRPALGIDAALAEILDGSGTRYWPDVVTACLCVFREKGFVFPE
jgi:putative nucleotidyltransferase with HDIG domain